MSWDDYYQYMEKKCSKPPTSNVLVLNIGNGWVAGGCWDDDITVLVMTGIIPENSLRLAPVSFGVPIWVPVSLRTHNQ